MCEFKFLASFVFILLINQTSSAYKGMGSLVRRNPCETKDENIMESFEDKDLHWYHFFQKFTPSTKLLLEFNSDVNVTLFDKRTASISVSRENIFSVLFFRPIEETIIIAKSLNPDEEPTIKSIKLNGLEICRNLSETDFQLNAVSYKTRKSSCGRRQIFYKELIVAGASTKPGDWPWHVAIYRIDFFRINYICGGTLLSKNMVLTAAHCVTIRGEKILAEALSVILGKYNLKGGDFSSEEREVHEIKVHSDFKQRYLENDIAMLKLRSEVTFNDYIQPACLWHRQVVDKLPSSTIYGTVVGWGIDHTANLSSQIRKAVLPILSYPQCVKHNALYYSNILNDNNFCAGTGNGTSPCNGDSGGGFVVFVPDRATDETAAVSGAWYVRGIVSSAVPQTDTLVCDPRENAVFTDVAKYTDWIQTYMDTN